MIFHDLDLRLKLLAVLTALIFIILIISLVKKRLLKENYAILWIIFAFVTTLMALNYYFVIWVSHLLGIFDPNNTLFFASIIFLILIVILFSIENSDLQMKVKNLIQKTSLLEQKISQKRKKSS